MYTVKTRPGLHHDKHHRGSPPAFARADAASRTHAPQRLWWVDILAQSFVDAKGYCSTDVHRVFLKKDLPLALEQVAARINPDRQIWLAWTDGQYFQFLVAQMASEARDIGRNAAIHLFFYDMDGQLQASGKWILHPNGNWSLHSVDAANAIA